MRAIGPGRPGLAGASPAFARILSNMDPSPPPRAAAAGNRHGRHRERRGTGWRAWKAVTRSVVGLASVVVLMLTGLAYSQAHGLLSGITVSQALGSDEPRS